MKLPKLRADIYVVVRVDYDGGGEFNTSLLGCSSTLMDADSLKDTFEQTWLEKVGNLEGVTFSVRMTTMYA